MTGRLAALALAALLAAPPAGTVCAAAGAVEIADGCCKTCRKGKACGDSCIARDRRCTRPPGCACDA